MRGLIAFVMFASLALAAKAQTFEITSRHGTICSAFSYDANLIATAAHCTYGSTSFTLSQGGQASLLARGAFDNGYLTENEKTARDVAVLTTGEVLPDPIPHTLRPARIGEIVEIVPPGFGFRECTVVAAYGDAYDIACEVRDGWSGAPIYARTRYGDRVLIGLLSGRIDNVGDGLAAMVHIQAIEDLRW